MGALLSRIACSLALALATLHSCTIPALPRSALTRFAHTLRADARRFDAPRCARRFDAQIQAAMAAWVSVAKSKSVAKQNVMAYSNLLLNTS